MTTTTIARTDEQLQREVLDELKWDARVHPNEIGVSVKDGVVTLSGSVDAYTKEWAAEEIALRVRGVKAVANDLEVRLPSFAERSDADLAAAAVHALEWDAFVPIERLEVSVTKGKITLRGEVDWGYQKQDAERVVRRLAGVRSVNNFLTVHPLTKVWPAEVKQKIEAALVRTAQLDAQHIKVEAHNGRVILRGAVHAWAEKDEAERVAWSAPGVTEVDNHITIAS